MKAPSRSDPGIVAGRDLSHVPTNAGFYLLTCPKCGGKCVTAARKFKKCPFCPHNINVRKAKRDKI